MQANTKPPLLTGIVGGMGPLASAEFVRTIYEFGIHRLEQSAPAVVLYSDPGFPDRTEALLSHSIKPLLNRLEHALHVLLELGASRIVICCFTVHALLDHLHPRYRDPIVSLIDIMYQTLQHTSKRHLLLCTIGSQQTRLFERHPLWPAFKDLMVLPDATETAALHREIYRSKSGMDLLSLTALIKDLLAHHSVDSFIAGCTELHIAAKHMTNGVSIQCLDPLAIAARQIADGTLGATLGCAPLLERVLP
jgi:aspartate racemase